MQAIHRINQALSVRLQSLASHLQSAVINEYVVVGGQHSNIMPLEWEYITYCSGVSDSSSYHTNHTLQAMLD